MRFVSESMAAQVRSDALGLWCFVHVLVVAMTTVLVVAHTGSQGMGWSLWILYYPLVVGGLQALLLKQLLPRSRNTTIVALTCFGLALAVIVFPHLYSMILFVFAAVPLMISVQGDSPWFILYYLALALGSGAVTGLIQWRLLRRAWNGARILIPVHAMLVLVLSRWPSSWDALAAAVPQLPTSTSGADPLIAAVSGLVVAVGSGLALLQLNRRAAPTTLPTPALARRRRKRR